MPKIQLRNLGLYYETFGQGEPLLLIHGLGSSSRDWENQVPYFSGRYRVVTPDLRGDGKSEKPLRPFITRTLPVTSLDASLSSHQRSSPERFPGSSVIVTLASANWAFANPNMKGRRHHESIRKMLVRRCWFHP